MRENTRFIDIYTRESSRFTTGFRRLHQRRRRRRRRRGRTVCRSISYSFIGTEPESYISFVRLRGLPRLFRDYCIAPCIRTSSLHSSLARLRAFQFLRSSSRRRHFDRALLLSISCKRKDKYCNARYDRDFIILYYARNKRGNNVSREYDRI